MDLNLSSRCWLQAPDGESQPMTDVNLFISMEKIMVLNVDIQDCLMDHPLRTISYIADIGDLVVLMVKRGLDDLTCDAALRSTQPKMLCHVFQSDEVIILGEKRVKISFQINRKKIFTVGFFSYGCF